MKPKLIITCISEKESHIKLNEKLGPREIAFEYEISVVGYGNFNNYIKGNKTFDKEKLATDILEGRIDIVGVS